MTDHLEPGRNLLQHLGDIVAQLREMRSAAAGANFARRMDDLFTRKMIRQRFANRLTPFSLGAFGLIGIRGLRRNPRRFAFLQILQHHLKLDDLGIALLGRLVELHPPQLGQLGLVLFDQDAQREACEAWRTQSLGRQRSKAGLDRPQRTPAAVPERVRSRRQSG